MEKCSICEKEIKTVHHIELIAIYRQQRVCKQCSTEITSIVEKLNK